MGTIVRQAYYTPVPRRPPPPFDFTPQNLLNSLLAPGNPYVPVDISGRLDAPRRSASIYDQPSRNLALLIPPSTALPPANVGADFASSSPRRLRFDFASQNLLVTTLLNAPTQIPANYDTAQINRRVWRPGLNDVQSPMLALQAAPPPVLPPTQYDLSLPQRRQTRPGLYDISLNTPLLASFVPVMPPPSFSNMFGQRPAARYQLAHLLLQPAPEALMAVPTLLAGIPNLFYNVNSGVKVYDASIDFAGATSYSIVPALDTGITFNTGTGVLSTNTATASQAVHGPYIITGTNVNGDTPSNSFTITISAGDYHVDGPRLTRSTTGLGSTYGLSGPGVTRDAPESEDLS